MSAMLSSRSAHSNCRLAKHRAFQPASVRHASLIVSPPGRFSGPSLVPGNRKIVCHGLFGLGLPEVAVIAGVAALIWGPSKLPEIGKGLGKTLKSFQSAAKEFEQELKTEMNDTPAAQEKAADAPAAAPAAEKPKQN